MLSAMGLAAFRRGSLACLGATSAAACRLVQTSTLPKDDTLAQVLAAQVEEMQAAGTYKQERILTSPQKASISKDPCVISSFRPVYVRSRVAMMYVLLFCRR